MNEGADGHQKFREFCALANSGSLSVRESRALDRHLRTCAECRELFTEFELLSEEGIPLLAANYTGANESEGWDSAVARRRLFARIRAAEPPSLSLDPYKVPRDKVPRGSGVQHLWGFGGHWGQAALAACLVIAVGAGAYQLGSRRHRGVPPPVIFQQVSLANLLAEKQAVELSFDTKAKETAQLQDQSRKQKQEIDRLRLALGELQERSSAFGSARDQAEEKLQEASQRGDALAGQLQQAQRDYQGLQAELAALRTDRDHDALQAVTLQARIDELTAANRDQDRRLRDSDQFLASDRDIRELMGARKLYIADVFDVDSGSRTRKPFGRVFYTQNKSLIFYAFDLDHQPGIKNASTFQVWGQRETALGEQAHPMNLGILYMDSEANRRWVLRSDDPKQLNEIDAVFVTVEPHGGSQKPTGKPFLYALLRKEANHP
jgi:anti-sigma-K factor RskA